MPAFIYNFVGAAGPCAAGAGPGSSLPTLPTPISLTWAQLINAQLRLGVYPAAWAADEMAWRVYSFLLTMNTVAAVAAAGGIPPGLPPRHIAPGVAAPGGGIPQVGPSPVATGVDATEKGQLTYHIGTGVGGSLAEYLVRPAGSAATTSWYPFHLSRAIANGGKFNFANASRPDIVIFAVDPAAVPPRLHGYVVWENKGRCVQVGAAVLMQALAQAQALMNMTKIPGGAACAPCVPHCHIASLVDRNAAGNFQVRTTDPPGPPKSPFSLQGQSADRFLKGYYAPFVEVIRNGPSSLQPYNGRRFRTVQLPKQVRLGLDEEIYVAWSKSSSFAAEIGRIHSTPYAMKPSATVYIHKTGISTEFPSQ